MPTNKNALTRYALIDKMLANHYRAYSIQDITDSLAGLLPKYGQEPVTKRCVEKDINYLQYESPFLVDIEEYWIEATDRNDHPYKKRCVRYSDHTFSIFKPKLKEDEVSTLSIALDALGGFDGLEAFEWIGELKRLLNIESRKPIIYVSKNLLSNSSMIVRLFTAIKSKVALTLNFHTFQDINSRSANVIPHLIREYNNRWFLIASACDTNKILTFPLDRIDGFVENPTLPYLQPADEIEERYEDIIGVTYLEESPLEEIIFWVSDRSKDYLITKPIHGSQSKYSNDRELQIRKKYPYFSGGEFFKILCKVNYELIRELTSFGKELIVLSPSAVVEKVYEWINDSLNEYDKMIVSIKE